MRKLSLPPLLAAAAAAALVLGSIPAHTEITTQSRPGGELVTAPNARLQMQCWQKGSKILEETDLEGVDLGTVLRSNSMSLRRRGQDGTSVVVVPFNDTVCTVSQTR